MGGHSRHLRVVLNTVYDFLSELPEMRVGRQSLFVEERAADGARISTGAMVSRETRQYRRVSLRG